MHISAQNSHMAIIARVIKFDYVYYSARARRGASRQPDSLAILSIGGVATPDYTHVPRGVDSRLLTAE